MKKDYLKQTKEALDRLTHEIRDIRGYINEMESEYRSLARGRERAEKLSRELAGIYSGRIPAVAGVSKRRTNINLEIKEAVAGRIDPETVLDKHPELSESEKGAYRAHITMGHYGKVEKQKQPDISDSIGEELRQAVEKGLDIDEVLDRFDLSATSKAAYKAHVTMGHYGRSHSAPDSIQEQPLAPDMAYAADEVKKKLGISTAALAVLVRTGKIRKAGNREGINYYNTEDVDLLSQGTN